MNYIQSCDLDQFKCLVKQEIQNYQTNCLRYDSKVKEVVQNYQNNSQRSSFSSDSSCKKIDLSHDLNNQLKPDTLKEALEQAELLLENPKIKNAICPVLRPATNDLWEISKTIIPVLVTIVPLNVLVFTALAIIISKVGVNHICKN